MEFSQIYQKRERLTVRIRREASKKDFQNWRNNVLMKAYGFNPLKSAKLQYQLLSLQKSVKGETADLDDINGVLDEIFKEVVNFEQEPLHFNYDVLTLLKEVYQKIVYLKSRTQRNSNLNSQCLCLQKKIIKLMSSLPNFNLITQQNFIGNSIPHFILELLNEKRMVKTALIFLSSVISIDSLKDILITYHPVLQKLFQQTQAAASNLKKSKSVSNHIYLLQCWNSLRIQDYTFQNLQTYQSVFMVSLHVLANHELYIKSSQSIGSNMNSPLINALSIIQKYINYFREEFIQLPAFQNSIVVLMNLLKLDQLSLNKCDVLRVIHSIISISSKSKQEIFYNNQYINTLINLIPRAKYNCATIFVIGCLLQQYVNHPSYYQLLSGLVREYVENQYLPYDIRAKIWNQIQIWFEEKDHQQNLSDMDVHVLKEISLGKQAFNQDSQPLMWMRVVKMGYNDLLPNYLLDCGYYVDAQSQYTMTYMESCQ